MSWRTPAEQDADEIASLESRLARVCGIATWALNQHKAWIQGVDRMPIGADGIAEVDRLLGIVSSARGERGAPAEAGTPLRAGAGTEEEA